MPIRPIALLFAALVLGNAGAAASEGDAWSLCARETGRLETALGIPSHILTAISLVESGRSNPATGERTAWPWAVMAEGKGRYLPSKAAAIHEVRGLQAKGVKNIDVGCMQVNLKYHPEAFASLDEAFEPSRNAAYAARFLTELKIETQSWQEAVGFYHSRTVPKSESYRSKVLSAWNAVRGKGERRNEPLIAAVPEGGAGRLVRLSSAPTDISPASARPGAILVGSYLFKRHPRPDKPLLFLAQSAER